MQAASALPCADIAASRQRKQRRQSVRIAAFPKPEEHSCRRAPQYG